MSKDVAIAAHFHPLLADLVEKGTKYRESFAGLHPVPPTSGEDSPEGRILYMVECALDRFVERAVERDVPDFVFGEWRALVRDRVSEAASRIGEASKRRLMGEVDHMPTVERCADALAAMQEAFVICEADKESGVYTFVCRRHYHTLLATELQGQTYDHTGTGSARARQTSSKITKAVQANALERRAGKPSTHEYDMSSHPARDPTQRNTAYVQRLLRDFEFCKRWDMIKSFTKDNRPLEQEDGETEEEFFIRIHQLAQQYGALKTHKIIPKMRSIAGGHATR